MTRRTVLVIGAGIAGLSAGYTLQQAGFAVRVFEAADFCGGRMTERRHNTILYNTGARLIYPFGRSLNGLIGKLALEPAIVKVPGPSADSDGHRIDLLPGWLTFRDSPDKLGLLRLASDLMRLRFQTDPDDVASAPDRQTVAEYIAATAGQDFLRTMIEPVFRGARSWNPEEISAAFFTSTAAHLLGVGHVFTFREGIGQLVNELARGLDVQLGVRVTRVTQDAEVTYTARGETTTARFDVVVCAVEGARVEQLADLTEPERRFFQSVRYNSLGIVHYALKRDVAPVLKFLPRDANILLSTYQQLPASAQRGPQLYCQITPEATLHARAQGRTADLDSLVRAEVRAQYPTIDDDVAETFSQWIEHKLPVPYPSYPARLRAFRQGQAAEQRRVYFCGDYLAQALVTGACRSGIETAERVRDHWG